MKIREFCRDYLGSAALRYTMLLAVAGFVLMVGVAVLNTGSS
jgi:hypothetical protein